MASCFSFLKRRILPEGESNSVHSKDGQECSRFHHLVVTIEDSKSRNLAHPITNIPLDLTLEIFSKLPTKSLLLCQSVSKHWFSVIRSKDFTSSFLARSRSRPHFLFTGTRYPLGKRIICLAPEGNVKSPTFISNMMISNTCNIIIHPYPFNGFICCSVRGTDTLTVCNPTTKQMVILPDIPQKDKAIYTCLGYDPVEDQYKVLCVKRFAGRKHHFVCTVNSKQKQEWRKVFPTFLVDPLTCVRGNVCIDGAIYHGFKPTTIARFDVRSEKYDLIQGHEGFNSVVSWATSSLAKHQGKLTCVCYDEHYDLCKIRVWVLQDAEKHEWSSMTYQSSLFMNRSLYRRGITNNEVIMFSKFLDESSKLFYVYYFDMVTETVRRVEIDGFEMDLESRLNLHMSCYPGHIENITFL